MPDFKPSRNLDRYPLSFHHAVAVASPTGYPLGFYTSRFQLRKAQTLFSSFRAGWEIFPNHPTSRLAEGKEFRLKSLPRDNGWLLVCLEQPKLGKILQSALDRLGPDD